MREHVEAIKTHDNEPKDDGEEEEEEEEGGEADPTDREREQPERKCYFSRVPLPRTNEKRRRRRLVISRETLQSWNLASGRARATWKPVNLTAVTLARSLHSRRKRHKRP